ncbi:MAG TPA: alpha/beta hydrolase [Ilumatobacteraceae bacterium]|nr:alpha/beta hydrolase [Ilumatobacteraceae bacterium]HRB03553.1 alpha/beta hydrolase [Ilumatobacteraceae bacterium]
MVAALDTDAAQLLGTWAASAAGPVEDQPVEQLRNSGLINEQVTGIPPQLHQVIDLEVPSDSGPTVPVRVYRPSAAELPVIVYAHGGGWTLLSIASADTLCRTLARDTQCVVVSVGYRLAPEHPFPAAFDDMWAATVWVANGGLGFVPPRLAVSGDSAGGNLAAAVALTARDTGEVRVDLQLLLYPATNIDLTTPSMLALGPDPRFRLTHGAMTWFWSNYLGDLAHSPHLTDQRAVPAAAISLAGVATAIVVTPGYDPLKDDGKIYAQRLAMAGVQVDLIEPETLPHGFGMFLGAVPAARTAFEDITTRVRRAMHTRSAIAEEFRRTPFGRHSAELQLILHEMRSEPIAGKPFLFISETNQEWVLGRYSDDVPPVPVVDWSTRFSDLESAEWHVFKLRWSAMFGEELGDD